MIWIFAAHLPMRQWKYASRVPTEAWLEGGMPKSRRVTETFSTQKLLQKCYESPVLSPVLSPVPSPVFYFLCPFHFSGTPSQSKFKSNSFFS